jgi:diguanylate cyclase (GGDEF)-like protein
VVQDAAIVQPIPDLNSRPFPDEADRLAVYRSVMSGLQLNPQVRLGVALCLAYSVGVLATVWLLVPGPALRQIVLVQFASMVLTLVLAGLLRRPPNLSRWLLVFPLVLMADLVAGAAAAKAVGPAYSGFFTVAFIYVGLTQRRWTSVFLLPAAIPAWYFCQVGSASVIAVRLPISVAVWLVVGELLAARDGRIRIEMGRLRNAAQTDHLTGLGNRRGLAAGLAALSPGDNVILLDLDNFKEVNDSRGHAVGDQMIADFAAAAKAVLRSGDRAYRYGGEELVNLMGGGGDSAGGASSLLERLERAWKAVPGRPTFSGGASVHGAGSPAETLNQADVALYRAKEAGRDCWTVAAASALKADPRT